jgi:hypothetical protein
LVLRINPRKKVLIMKALKIKNKLLTIVLIVVLSLLISGAPLAVLALEINDGENEYVYQWSGNGKDSLDCSKAGEGDRPDDGTGWIHWVFTGKGNSTDAILTLGGSGNGSYSPGEPFEAEVWHFYTPYFDVDEITASINLIGGDKGPGIGLVISDYCPGEEEEETGSIIIEKLIKAEVDAEVVIPSNKVFFFNIYNNETDELVQEDVELEVIDGVGTITIDNLPLGIYRVEEVANGGYQVILDPEDGIVDLTAEENEVTVVVVNTPKPELVIEKVLLDAEGVEVENSDVEFTVILDGGVFDEQEIAFSVNEPAVLGIGDGLEFDVPYTVTEVPKESYIFISIDPEEDFTLTDEENEVTVTVVNQIISPPPPPPVPPVIIFASPVPPQVIVVPPAEPQVSPPPQVIVIPPAAPQVVVQLPPQGGAEEEDAVAFFVSPEDPLAEPEEVLVVQPAMPLSTPRTGGFYLNMILASFAFIGSGIIIRKQLIK